MDGIGGLCVRCQAQLGPGARFCPACGLRSSPAVPAGPPGGPGSTVAASLSGVSAPPAAQWPSRPLRDPLPTEPSDDPPPTATTVTATKSDSTLPAAPQPAPYQLPAHPPADPPPAYPPPGYPPPASPPAGYQQPARLPTSARPDFGPVLYQPPGSPAGPPRQPPRRHDRNRSGSSRALWILLPLLLIGGAAAGVVAEHPFSNPSPQPTPNAGQGPSGRAGASAGPSPGGAASPASTASGTGTPAASTAPSGGATAPSQAAAPSAAAVSEQRAAASVATLLSQSDADRAATITAAADVANCGPDLAADPKAFDDAASSRQALLATLARMPGRAALPAGLLGDLTSAWQASVSADQAYARWATDEIDKGCLRNDASDPGYQASVIPDEKATKDKTAFTAAWNPIAASYGLTQYRPDQL
jgi:hypothetical protein